ncbi:hypothetical protein Nepgr_006325 [Nepenthes gracilis]|uniref:Uncharacterized protein n=1 Tax=Nepenthes gracilis TaxID=150966 RepID=A0AAD3XHH2_NEPGR|nr:hypothetical protein Nepgr_006325 [Nepenthes gracilis]
MASGQPIQSNIKYFTPPALGVRIFGKLGLLHDDPFVIDVAKMFINIRSIFTDTNLLRHANMDTSIAFKSYPLLLACCIPEAALLM